MDKKQIDRFFRTVAQGLDRPAKVILTGAAAGSLLGHVRPSLDIDFGIELVGKLQVTLLDPAYWTIGKMTRFLDSDVWDVAKVISGEGVSSRKLVRLWGKALRASPRSTASFQFRRHVEDFLRRHGKSIWGKRFDPELSVRHFRSDAGISL